MKDSEYLTLITNAENFLKCKPNRISAVDIIHDILLAEPEIDFTSANKKIKEYYNKIPSYDEFVNSPEKKMHKNQNSYISHKNAYHTEEIFRQNVLKKQRVKDAKRRVKPKPKYEDSIAPETIRKIEYRSRVLSNIYGIKLNMEQKNNFAKQWVL